jgi:fibronectin-binding autotransporter adhesin
MTQRSKITLKSYFEAGDRPNDIEFNDLLDSIIVLDDTNGVANDTTRLLGDLEFNNLKTISNGNGIFGGNIVAGSLTEQATYSINAFSTHADYPVIFASGSISNVLFEGISGDATSSIKLTDDSASVSFGTHTNKGVLSIHENDIITYSTGSTPTDDNIIFMSGSLGVGTTTPKSKLYVTTGGTLPTNIAGNVATFQQAGLSNYAASIAVIAGNASTATLYFGDTDSQGRGAIRYDNTNDSLVFRTNGSNTGHLTINNSGNVGIGTTNPTAKLDIEGTFDSHLIIGKNTQGGNINFRRGSNGATAASLGFSSATEGNNFRFKGTSGGSMFTWDLNVLGNGNGEVMRLANSGYLGIGTTNPTAKLDIESNVSNILRLHKTDTDDSTLNFTNTTDTTGYFIGMNSAEEFAIGKSSDLDNSPFAVWGSGGNAHFYNTTTIETLSLAQLTLIGGLQLSSSTNQNYWGTSNFADSLSSFPSVGTNTWTRHMIHFPKAFGSNDPGYIVHQTSNDASQINYAVFHINPSDDNSSNDYIAIHGSDEPELVKIDTAGGMELNTTNARLGIGTTRAQTSADGAMLSVAGDIIIKTTGSAASSVIKFSKVNNVATNPSIQFDSSALLAAEDDFIINIDSDHSGTNAKFSIRKDGTTSAGTEIFSVDEDGDGLFAGTLGVTGISTLAGLLNANGGIAVDSTNFTVNGTTGNTAIAGTLGVGGATTLKSNLAIRNSGDTYNVMLFSNTNSVAANPDIQFNGSALLAAEADFIINIDSDYNTSNAKFSIRKDSTTSAGAEIFSVNESGHVIATSFEGDGSLLTNVVPGAVTGLILNAADNRIATTNNQNTLNGEANLTFDGSTLAVTGATTISTTLGVTGISTLAGLLNANGGIKVDTNKFTVADGTGNTAIAGTLGVSGDVTLSSAATSTSDTTALMINISNVVKKRTLGTGAFNPLYTLPSATSSTLGGVTFASGSNNRVLTAIDADSINGEANLTFDGSTLAVTGATTISTTLGVTGISTLAGLLNANGGIKVDTNKFTVADGTGNTAIAGTLGVSGAVTLSSTAASTDTTALMINSSNVVKKRQLDTGAFNPLYTLPTATSSTLGGVTFASGSNNRVLTAIDADSINGEANLTFDGSTLTVTGSAAIGKGITISSTDNNSPSSNAYIFGGLTDIRRSRIAFTAAPSSNDSGFIEHLTSTTTTNKSVIRLCPSDDSSGDDYVSIGGRTKMKILNYLLVG